MTVLGLTLVGIGHCLRHMTTRSGVGIDECAAAARSRGFPVFALQGKGQCFFGSMADVARLQASQKLSDDRCNNLPCPASAATCPGRINKVFFLIGAHTPLRPCQTEIVLLGWLCILAMQQCCPRVGQ
jgi:hypothetical protein